MLQALFTWRQRCCWARRPSRRRGLRPEHGRGGCRRQSQACRARGSRSLPQWRPGWSAPGRPAPAHARSQSNHLYSRAQGATSGFGKPPEMPQAATWWFCAVQQARGGTLPRSSTLGGVAGARHNGVRGVSMGTHTHPAHTSWTDLLLHRPGKAPGHARTANNPGQP